MQPISSIHCPEDDEGTGANVPSGLEIDPSRTEIPQRDDLIRMPVQKRTVHADVLDTPLLVPPVYHLVSHYRRPHFTEIGFAIESFTAEIPRQFEFVVQPKYYYNCRADCRQGFIVL